MAEILDSGNRRQFGSGAVRDIDETKGRMDLLPLDIVAELYLQSKNSTSSYYDYRDKYYSILKKLYKFLNTGLDEFIYEAIDEFSTIKFNNDIVQTLMEVSVHYKDGANKYRERNWQKGIPTHSFLDSGLRHLVKCIRGDEDEPHNRAFVWNMLGLLWTKHNNPLYEDLPYIGFQKSFVDQLPDINNQKVCIGDVYILNDENNKNKIFIVEANDYESGEKFYKEISLEILLLLQKDNHIKDSEEN